MLKCLEEPTDSDLEIEDEPDIKNESGEWCDINDEDPPSAGIESDHESDEEQILYPRLNMY